MHFHNYDRLQAHNGQDTSRRDQDDLGAALAKSRAAIARFKSMGAFVGGVSTPESPPPIAVIPTSRQPISSAHQPSPRDALFLSRQISRSATHSDDAEAVGSNPLTQTAPVNRPVAALHRPATDTRADLNTTFASQLHAPLTGSTGVALASSSSHGAAGIGIGTDSAATAADLRLEADALDSAAARAAHHERRERRAALLREAARLRAETAALQRELPDLEEELHYLANTRLAALLRERDALQAASTASVQRRFAPSSTSDAGHPQGAASSAAASRSISVSAASSAAAAPAAATDDHHQPVFVRPAVFGTQHDRNIANHAGSRGGVGAEGGCFSCLNRVGGEAALIERVHRLIRRVTQVS